ncbi:MAG: hypothetical protein JXP34_08325 [Planctomycetes bacterium]|nr:hypothetical protein [Planctomycetota bacterium]
MAVPDDTKASARGGEEVFAPAVAVGDDPSRQTADIAMRVLNGVRAYGRFLRLYPDGHRRITCARDEVVSTIRDVVEERREFSIAARGSALVVNGGIAVLDSPIAEEFALALRHRRIDAIRFLPGITAGDLATLGWLLAVDHRTLLRDGGVEAVCPAEMRRHLVFEIRPMDLPLSEGQDGGQDDSTVGPPEDGTTILNGALSPIVRECMEGRGASDSAPADAGTTTTQVEAQVLEGLAVLQSFFSKRSDSPQGEGSGAAAPAVPSGNAPPAAAHPPSDRSQVAAAVAEGPEDVPFDPGSFEAERLRAANALEVLRVSSELLLRTETEGDYISLRGHVVRLFSGAAKDAATFLDGLAYIAEGPMEFRFEKKGGLIADLLLEAPPSDILRLLETEGPTQPEKIRLILSFLAGELTRITDRTPALGIALATLVLEVGTRETRDQMGRAMLQARGAGIDRVLRDGAGLCDRRLWLRFVDALGGIPLPSAVECLSAFILGQNEAKAVDRERVGAVLRTLVHIGCPQAREFLVSVSCERKFLRYKFRPEIRKTLEDVLSGGKGVARP